MNKTKILTSLSALAAVFVFNGDAMAGVFDPTCDGNQYTVELSYVDITDVIQSEQCRDGENCVPSCPAGGYVYYITYGDGVSEPAPEANCSGSHTYNGWLLQGLKVMVNNQEVTFTEVPIEAGTEIKDEYFVYNGKPVDTGSTFKLIPADVAIKEVNVNIVCTYENDGLPDGVALGGISHEGGNVGETVYFTDKCTTSGAYSVTQWQYKGGMVSNWTDVPDATSFKIPTQLEGSSMAYDFRPKKYNPNEFNIVLKGGENGGTNYETLKYTNPVEAAAGTWRKGTTSITSVTLQSLDGLTLRGMVKTDEDKPIPVAVESEEGLTGDLIMRSSENNSNATLPDLDVVYAARTYYPAWARNCAPVESASGLPTATCTLDLDVETGQVTYENACAAGFHSANNQ